MVIGESSTPLSNLLLEELAIRYDLPRLRPLTKWGSWQAHYPNVACGLKRGFSFFHHEIQQGHSSRVTIDSHFLVAASPHNSIADTHWYRADFDHFLVEQAKQVGVTYIDELRLERFVETGDYVELAGMRRDTKHAVRARFVVDASGPRGCLHRLLNLTDRTFRNYPPTQALYSHFSGVQRMPFVYPDPPYPIEDAAVHHVFDGGWAWLLHFNNGITSAGVAATVEVAKRLNFAEGEIAWVRLLELIPVLARQFADAKPILPFTYLPRLSFRSTRIAGERWALLPSAVGFVDPLLSTGFPLTLLGITRLATTFEDHWNEPALQEALVAYETTTLEELDATARLIGAMYANMNNFSAFRAISILYFAAASFSEAARRLEKPELAQSFLLCKDARFGPACRTLLDWARIGIEPQETAGFIEKVMRAIEPFDVAGLCEQHSMPWFPVDGDDVRRSAGKLNATRREIERMLERSGFYPAFSALQDAP
jgi:tetracycline 7-halogenase / FADH2 O2-dependent halogenase